MDWSLLTYVSSTVVVIFAFAGVIWKLSAWKHKLDDLEPLRINASRIISMIDQVAEMHKVIIGKALAKTTSPISLTEYGAKLADQINADQLVHRYADELKKEVEGKNAYQIQQHCFDFAKKDLLKRLHFDDEKHFDVINEAAYENGVEIESLMETVVGIKLRDKILSMTGKSHQEIDDHSLED